MEKPTALLRIVSQNRNSTFAMLQCYVRRLPSKAWFQTYTAIILLNEVDYLFYILYKFTHKECAFSEVLVKSGDEVISFLSSFLISETNLYLKEGKVFDNCVQYSIRNYNKSTDC